MCFIDDERGAKVSGRWVGQDVDVWEWSQNTVTSAAAWSCSGGIHNGGG